jgi:hypothetical protein
MPTGYFGGSMRRQIGTALQFVGGRLGGVAVSGIIFGVFTIGVGMTPGEFFALFFEHPPRWLSSPFISPSIVLIGLAAIYLSVTFNVWSQKQKAINSLAEHISDAIGDLVNRNPVPSAPTDINQFESDYHSWIAKVSKELENRAFFTRADQLHFDRLGYVDTIAMHGQPKLDWLHSQLKLKFERLRDVINWSQQRRH